MSGAAHPESSRRIHLLVGFLFVLAVPFAFASSPLIFDDGDVSWHLAAGRWILAHQAVPVADPFSFTMAGAPWVAHEWLAEILYALAFQAAGYPGIAALVFLALAATNLVIFLSAGRAAGMGGAVAMFLLLAATLLVLFPFTLARPHVLVWPLLAGWAAGLLRARDRGRAPSLALALVMLVWTNLHGSFPLGIVILGCVMLDVLIRFGWTGARGWMGFCAAATVATLLNVNGLPGLLHPFTIMGMETAGEIAEWRPSDPIRTPAFFAFALLWLGLVVLRRMRLSAGETLLLTALTAMALMQVRHQSWLVILAALILVRTLSAGKGPVRSRWVAAGGLAGLAVLRALSPISPGQARTNPQWLAAHVPQELRDQPVLNDYSIGGPLILAGMRPYIDGRADMYGDTFFADYIAIAGGDRRRFDAAIRRYGIAWTIFPPHKKIVATLDSSPGWRRLYADGIAVIHVRRPAGGTARPAMD